MLSFLYGPTLTSIHDYWKTIALAIWTSVSNVMSLFFNMLSRFFIAFLPRTKQNYSSSIIHLVHSPPSFLPYHSLEKHKENKIQKKKRKEKAKRLHFLNYPPGSFSTFSSFLSFPWKRKEKRKKKKNKKNTFTRYVAFMNHLYKGKDPSHCVSSLNLKFFSLKIRQFRLILAGPHTIIVFLTCNLANLHSTTVFST